MYFAQILTFISRWEFDKCVNRYNGDFCTKELNCLNLFIQLSFGQLTSLNSLRDICLCLKAHKNKLYHLGIKQNVNQSSLSRANESRDWRIFANFGQHLISIVQPLYSEEKITDVRAENQIFALDSTTISLSIKLFTWALGKYSRGAVKVHPLLDLRGSIPTFIHISHGKCHDSNVLDFMPLEKDAIYVMDKAYVDLVALCEMELIGAFFVTRAKENMVFKIIETNHNIDLRAGLISDQVVVLNDIKSAKLYPNFLRRVIFRDSKKNITLMFIANNSELTALRKCSPHTHIDSLICLFNSGFHKWATLCLRGYANTEYLGIRQNTYIRTSYRNSFKSECQRTTYFI